MAIIAGDLDNCYHACESRGLTEAGGCSSDCPGSSAYSELGCPSFHHDGAVVGQLPHIDTCGLPTCCLQDTYHGWLNGIVMGRFFTKKFHSTQFTTSMRPHKFDEAINFSADAAESHKAVAVNDKSAFHRVTGKLRGGYDDAAGIADAEGNDHFVLGYDCYDRKKAPPQSRGLCRTVWKAARSPRTQPYVWSANNCDLKEEVLSVGWIPNSGSLPTVRMEEIFVQAQLHTGEFSRKWMLRLSHAFCV